MVISGVSKKTMDALRAKAAEIVATDASLLTVRSAAAKAAADSSRLTAMIGLSVIVASGVLALLILHLGIARPIHTMTAAMRRLAEKDLTASSPEYIAATKSASWRPRSRCSRRT